MNKTLRLITLICVFALTLSFTAFADSVELPDDEFDNIDKSEKTVVSVTENFDGIYRFIDVGQKPDLSAGSITAVYDDETTETVTLDDTYLPEELDTSVPGRLLLTVTAFETDFTLQFIVLDREADINRFADFNKTYWGYKKINHVVMAGFFEGKSETEFGVRENMTRAQFCQMLYNIYKNDDDVLNTSTQMSFTDVAADKWYYEAVMICAESGIVNGVGEGRFEPDSPITRQDAALMMMRILIGTDGIEAVDVEAALTAARESGIAAGDFDSTREYAKKAVAAALGVIYFGDGDGNITPLANITRAETAAMMSNLFFVGFEEPVEKKLIYISPENRENSYSGVNTTEHEQMQIVAEKMKVILEEKGYEVFIADKATSIRESEDGISRAEEAKNMGAVAYIALHSNAIDGTNSGKAQGCICFYNGNNEGAAELSQAIYDNLSALTPTADGGSRNDMLEKIPFVEVRLPEMANVLIEVEFHDYAPYAKWIVDNTDAIAQSIADGIDKHFS